MHLRDKIRVGVRGGELRGSDVEAGEHIDARRPHLQLTRIAPSKSIPAVPNELELGDRAQCGECNSDADCGGNELCNPGQFILNGGTLVGSFCQ